MQFKDITQGKQHFNIKYIHKCHFRTQQRKQLFILKLVCKFRNITQGKELFILK